MLQCSCGAFSHRASRQHHHAFACVVKRGRRQSGLANTWLPAGAACEDRSDLSLVELRADNATVTDAVGNLDQPATGSAALLARAFAQRLAVRLDEVEQHDGPKALAYSSEVRIRHLPARADILRLASRLRLARAV